MIILAAAIGIGIILIAVTSHFFQGKIDDENIASAKEVMNMVENELFLATKVRPGYIRSFDIPEKLNEEEYNLTIDNGVIVLTYKQIDMIGTAPNISGQLVKGNNLIKNYEGKICLNIETC